MYILYLIYICIYIYILPIAGPKSWFKMWFLGPAPQDYFSGAVRAGFGMKISCKSSQSTQSAGRARVLLLGPWSWPDRYKLPSREARLLRCDSRRQRDNCFCQIRVLCTIASGAIRSRSAAYRIKDNRVQVESAIAYSEAWPVSKLAHLTLLLQNTVSSQTWSKIFSVSIWKRSTMFRFYSFFASSVACASPLTLSVRIAACIQSVSRRIHPFLVVAYFLLVRLL